jgi:hypothetical protein
VPCAAIVVNAARGHHSPQPRIAIVIVRSSERSGSADELPLEAGRRLALPRVDPARDAGLITTALAHVVEPMIGKTNRHSRRAVRLRARRPPRSGSAGRRRAWSM